MKNMQCLLQNIEKTEILSVQVDVTFAILWVHASNMGFKWKSSFKANCGLTYLFNIINYKWDIRPNKWVFYFNFGSILDFRVWREVLDPLTVKSAIRSNSFQLTLYWGSAKDKTVILAQNTDFFWKFQIYSIVTYATLLREGNPCEVLYWQISLMNIVVMVKVMVK